MSASEDFVEKADFVEETAEVASLQDSRDYKRALRKIDLWMVLWYSFVYLIVQIDKTNISNTAIINLEVGDGIMKQLGNLSSGQWAWCISAFYYPYLFLEPVSTLLLKKFSPRRWQAIIMVSWGTVAMCQGGVQSFAGLVVTRFLLGVCESGFYCGVLYHLSFFIKPRELPRRIAFFYASGMFSGVISGLLSFAISFLNGKGGLAGWRWVFIIQGIPAVLAGIVTFFILPNYPDDAWFLTPRERNLVLDSMPPSSPRKDGKAFGIEEIRVLVRSPTFYSYGLIWICHGIGGWGISFILPTVIHDLGFTDTAQSQLMTMPPAAFTFILLNTLGIISHKRIANGFQLALFLEALMIISYIVLLCIKNAVAKYMMIFLATAAGNSLYPILWPDRIRIVRGTSSAGLAIACTNAMAQTMGLIGPQIYQVKFGPDFHTSYGASVALCSGATGAILLTWWLVKREGLLDSDDAYAEHDSE